MITIQGGTREGLDAWIRSTCACEDDELLDEVELTANLIVAANQSEAHMSVTEIDEILGVFPRPRKGE